MAIKVFLKGTSDDRTELPEFNLNRQLKSHVIVKFVEHFEDENFDYLLTTWMPHGDLRSKMSKQKVQYLTEGEMRAPLTNVANALKTIHALGYTHNAVEPKNIFIHVVNHKYRVKLGGLSKSSQTVLSLVNDRPALEKTARCPY
jgi:serine/threonine protein kinase